MKNLPKFKSQEEEADFWMEHDTSEFWNAFEDIKDPLELSSGLKASIRERHEKTKAISIRLYPSQLRMAKAVAGKKHIPYQALLRSIIGNGLTQYGLH